MLSTYTAFVQNEVTAYSCHLTHTHTHTVKLSFSFFPVVQKFDYDSSTVRKCFFREALLQIFIPYILKQLNPCFVSVSTSPSLFPRTWKINNAHLAFCFCNKEKHCDWFIVVCSWFHSSLKHQELPRFEELIFEDFSHFILVENIFEEVVLQSVMKDIIMGQSSLVVYLYR